MTTNLVRVRWAVRATLTLGVSASVAANILHAHHNLISQTIAAWPPLALLVTVELISRVPVHRAALAAVRVLATVAISGIAAWISYWHMVGVVAHYGETGLSPYLMPFSVDGLIVVASICLVELSAQIRPTTAAAPITQPAAATRPEPVVTPSSLHPAGVPDELLPGARLVADAYRDATGTTITSDALAERLHVDTTTAARLLAALAATQPTTGTRPVPARINGTALHEAHL
jgi:hypothetical protein